MMMLGSTDGLDVFVDDLVIFCFGIPGIQLVNIFYKDNTRNLGSKHIKVINWRKEKAIFLK